MIRILVLLFSITSVSAAPIPIQPNKLDSGGKAVLGVHCAYNAKINSFYEKSVLEKAGAKEGDLITKIGDSKVKDLEGLINTLKMYRPGAKVKVELVRNKKVIILEVILGQESSVQIAPMPIPRKFGSQ